VDLPPTEWPRKVAQIISEHEADAVRTEAEGKTARPSFLRGKVEGLRELAAVLNSHAALVTAARAALEAFAEMDSQLNRFPFTDEMREEFSDNDNDPIICMGIVNALKAARAAEEES
jgi:hypothetical protein